MDRSLALVAGVVVGAFALLIGGGLAMDSHVKAELEARCARRAAFLRTAFQVSPDDGCRLLRDGAYVPAALAEAAAAGIRVIAQ